MRRAYVSMISYTGKPDVETQQSLLVNVQDCAAHGIDLKLNLSVGDSILPRARNRSLANFLASDCDDMLFIDDDLAFEEGAIRRILSHDCDLVGGTYPLRQTPVKFPIRRLEGGSFDPVTGLLKVWMMPTGFLRISRACASRMVDAYDGLKYKDKHAPNQTAWALFWFELRQGLEPEDVDDLVVWGEDYVFCDRWRQIGGDVYCDTLLRFRHIGRTAYEGCYGEVLPIAGLLKGAA